MGIRKSGKAPSFETINNINDARSLNRTAGLFENTNKIVKVEDFLTLDLADGRFGSPDTCMQIDFPFRSFLTKNVDSSNDDGKSYFYMALNKKNVASTWVPYYANEGKNNFDTWWGSYNIWYPYQAGRKVGINFSTDAQMYSGNANVNGNIGIVKPSTAPGTVTAVPATTATLLAASDALRNNMPIANVTGNIVYVSSDPLVSASIGFPVFHNQAFIVDWYGPVYVYALAAGNIHFLRKS